MGGVGIDVRVSVCNFITICFLEIWEISDQYCTKELPVGIFPLALLVHFKFFFSSVGAELITAVGFHVLCVPG